MLMSLYARAVTRYRGITIINQFESAFAKADISIAFSDMTVVINQRERINFNRTLIVYYVRIFFIFFFYNYV